MINYKRTADFTAAGGIILIVLLALAFLPKEQHEPPMENSHVLHAMWMVESGGTLNPPDGDGGRSIGPYQISKAYWQDAVEFKPLIGGEYDDCRSKQYAENVIEGYMLRYVPEAWNSSDFEVIAKTHVGGPDGRHENTSNPYWEKVQSALKEAVNKP